MEFFLDSRTGDKLSIEIDMGDALFTKGTYEQRCFLFLLEKIVLASMPIHQLSKPKVLWIQIQEIVDRGLCPSKEKALEELFRDLSPFCPKIRINIDGPWRGKKKPKVCDSCLMNCIIGIEHYSEDIVRIYYDARFPWFLVYDYIKRQEA